MAGIRHILGESCLTKFDALVLDPDTSHHNFEFYCLNCQERPRIGPPCHSLAALFYEFHHIEPGGSLTSVAEKTGVESLLTCSMLFSRRTLLIGRLQAVLARAPSRTDGR